MAHRATKGSGADFISALCFMIFGAAMAIAEMAGLEARKSRPIRMSSPGLARPEAMRWRAKAVA